MEESNTVFQDSIKRRSRIMTRAMRRWPFTGESM